MLNKDDPVDNLDLPPRLRHMFRREHIATIADLVSLSEWDLLSLRTFGAGSLELVTAKLAEHGLGLTDKDAASTTQ